MLYSTYVGAGLFNDAWGMALDAPGVVHVTGSVMGHDGLIPPEIDFPRTPGAYPNASACLAYYCQDAFFFNLRPAGQGSADLLYGAFFGGSASSLALSEMEWGADVALLYTTYILGSPVAPAGVAYDPAQNAIVGPLTLAPGVPLNVTFAVQTTITGGPDFAPQIVNRACVHTPGNTLLLLACSNEVRSWTYVYRIYLPLTLRNR